MKEAVILCKTQFLYDELMKTDPNNNNFGLHRNYWNTYKEKTVIFRENGCYGNTDELESSNSSMWNGYIKNAEDIIIERETWEYSDRTVIWCRNQTEWDHVVKWVEDHMGMDTSSSLKGRFIRATGEGLCVVPGKGLWGSLEYHLMQSTNEHWDFPISFNNFIERLEQGSNRFQQYKPGDLLTDIDDPYKFVVLLTKIEQGFYEGVIVKTHMPNNPNFQVGKIHKINTKNYVLMPDIELSLKIKTDV